MAADVAISARLSSAPSLTQCDLAIKLVLVALPHVSHYSTDIHVVY